VSASRLARVAVSLGIAAVLAFAGGCGYHTAGNNAPRIPTDVHTVYVPAIQNTSPTYRIGQTFTEALVQELRERTNYRIVTTNDGSADAVISGTITSVYIAPLTYDSATGRVSTSLVAVTMNARFTDSKGKVLWSNPSFLYREQYQESTEPVSFFEEEAPAVQRMAKNFSKELVASILEAF
jgi:Lipopolysaccharide-assembly